MTASQRIALATAFERLATRIAAQPVTLPHPVIRRKAHRVTASRRGTHRREEKYIEE